VVLRDTISMDGPIIYSLAFVNYQVNAHQESR
jgi:hypothetical protein